MGWQISKQSLQADECPVSLQHTASLSSMPQHTSSSRPRHTSCSRSRWRLWPTSSGHSCNRHRREGAPPTWVSTWGYWPASNPTPHNWEASWISCRSGTLKDVASSSAASMSTSLSVCSVFWSMPFVLCITAHRSVTIRPLQQHLSAQQPLPQQQQQQQYQAPPQQQQQFPQFQGQQPPVQLPPPVQHPPGGVSHSRDGFASQEPLPADACQTLYVDGMPVGTSKREMAHIFRPFEGYKVSPALSG